MATGTRRISVLLMAVALAGCAWTNGPSGPVAYTSDRGVDDQKFPSTYRTQLMALLKTYVNDPKGLRDAGIAEPVQRKVNGRLRYIVCLRYNARETDGSYEGVKERAGLFVDERLDRIIETDDLCEGAAYAPFPELEKLTR